MTRFIHLRRLWRFQGPLLVLIGVIMLVFAAQMAMDETAFDGMMVVPAEVTAAWNALRNGNPGGAGELATLIGHAFLHAGLDHLLGNMLFLWIFAALASELLGARWMLAVFVITAACGGICHVGLNADEAIPMLGASGAVMGFEGLYLAMAVRWHLPDPHVWPMSNHHAPTHRNSDQRRRLPRTQRGDPRPRQGRARTLRNAGHRFPQRFPRLAMDQTVELDGAMLSGILTDGGTILGTSRDKPHRMNIGGKETRHDRRHRRHLSPPPPRRAGLHRRRRNPEKRPAPRSRPASTWSPCPRPSTTTSR
jgi:membrane associated rhomboid family serine protease